MCAEKSHLLSRNGRKRTFNRNCCYPIRRIVAFVWYLHPYPGKKLCFTKLATLVFYAFEYFRNIDPGMRTRAKNHFFKSC